jgi:undecaprenyl-diphosphatase
MTVFDAIVLGIVQALTEFLPVSSTGHLILASKAMGLAKSEALDAFEVVVQSASVLAVIWYYRRKLLQIVQGLLRRDSDAVQLTLALFAGFLPSAVVGLTFGKLIKQKLFGVGPVAGALIVGGIAMIVLERVLRRRPPVSFTADTLPAPSTGLKIGFFQCCALWPGTSRSMSTIFGGRICGLSAARAAEFSFLLSIPTLLGATAHDLLKHGSALATGLGAAPMAAGWLTAFVVSLGVIHAFLGFVRHYSLEVFGWYRILIGIAVLLW